MYQRTLDDYVDKERQVDGMAVNPPSLLLKRCREAQEVHGNGRGEAAQDAGVEGGEGAAIRRRDHDHMPQEVENTIERLHILTSGHEHCPVPENSEQLIVWWSMPPPDHSSS